MRISIGIVLLLTLLTGAPVEAGCPSSDEIARRLAVLDLTQASRTSRYEEPPPEGLYRKAARNIGEPYVLRSGKRATTVAVIELGVEPLWKAINDEDHHHVDSRYVPVEYSEVIDGTPRGVNRLLFQYYSKMGVSRWWVVRVAMNSELFESSQQTLWEIYWEDDMDSVDPSLPPINRVSDSMTPIRQSRGAWLLVPLTPQCTLVEQFVWSDPGGFVSMAQPLVLKRALRNTMDGIVQLARDHVSEVYADATFLRPDGTPLD